MKWDKPEKKEYTYFHYYICRKGFDEIIGYQLEVELHYKDRNKLLQYFVASTLQNHPEEKIISVFNTYQHQVRTMLEKENYLTITEEDYESMRKATLIIKAPCNGIICTPFMKEKHIEKPPKQKSPVFVYLMHNRRNNYYKIGKSNNPNYREKTLQAEDPDVVLLKQWPGGDDLEKELHKMFKGCRVRGEWFSLTLDDINIIYGVAKEFNR